MDFSEQESSTATFINGTAMSCGLSSAPTAGDFPVRVSLNGQQFHDSAVTFHFQPVVYTLGGPPIGSDDGGSEVYIRGFGLTDDMVANNIQ